MLKTSQQFINFITIRNNTGVKKESPLKNQKINDRSSLTVSNKNINNDSTKDNLIFFNNKISDFKKKGFNSNSKLNKNINKQILRH